MAHAAHHLDNRHPPPCATASIPSTPIERTCITSSEGHHRLLDCVPFFPQAEFARRARHYHKLRISPPPKHMIETSRTSRGAAGCEAAHRRSTTPSTLLVGSSNRKSGLERDFVEFLLPYSNAHHWLHPPHLTAATWPRGDLVEGHPLPASCGRSFAPTSAGVRRPNGITPEFP